MNILCVDDDKNVLRFFQETLELLLPEDRAEFVSSGMEALTALTEGSFDLVITDLVMPEISGLDILRIVRNQGIDTEVLLVTGHASMDSALAALREDARDYLEKPVDIPLLLEKVANIREYRKMAQDAEDGRQAAEATAAEAESAIASMSGRIAAMRAALREAAGLVRAKTEPEVSAAERRALLQVLTPFLPERGATP